MGVFFDEHVFVTLSAEAITIGGREGYKFISVQNSPSSTSSAQISSDSTSTIGGKANGSTSVEAGAAASIGSGSNDIEGVTITAPAGSIVYVQAVKSRLNNTTPV